MQKWYPLMFVFAVACADDPADTDSPNQMSTCVAPEQLQADGTCGCPPGTQRVGTACQASAGCGAGTMPDPANPGMCIPVQQPSTCGAGMMPDPANPGTCIPVQQPATCGAGMMPDPANPGMCIPVQQSPGSAAASCTGADTSGDTYEAMQAMVTMRCGVCHRRSQAPRSGNLQLTGEGAMDRAEDLLALVAKPSCETTMPVVDQSGGDAALNNSWLYWKVAGMTDGTSALSARPDWMATMASCMQDAIGPYGGLMPMGATEPIESVVTAVRNWICAGAPGPAAGSMAETPTAGSGGM